MNVLEFVLYSISLSCLIHNCDNINMVQLDIEKTLSELDLLEKVALTAGI